MSVTVPTAEVPPTTEVGETEIPFSPIELIVRVADSLSPKVPVIVAKAEFETSDVAIANVAVVEPAGTITKAGT